MCGIWSVINLKKKNLDTLALRGLDSASRGDVVKLFQDFMQLKHRGPDNSYFETYNNVTIGFHRLAIMDDTFSANQPFILDDGNRTVIFICNGEIFNFKELIERYKMPSYIKNDCMVIPEIYMNMLKNGKECDFNRFIKDDVIGEFSCILYEFDHLKNLKKVIVARDSIGVRPLYYNPNPTDTLLFTSEIKGAISFDEDLKEFPPGHIFTYTLDELDNLSCDKYDFSTVYDVVVKDLSEAEHLKAVQTAVLNSVRRRLCADKPFAFLLSGGVDSSLVAAISAKILGKPINTFCCGLDKNSTDFKYAQEVATHIGSNHKEIYFTPEEGLASIPDVIRTIESFDVTSIRASVGQYMVCKYIGTCTDAKVLLTGEGSDELASSYLFNWYCPSGEELDKCAKEYIRDVHYYDIKRADRCITKFGMEGRIPLLDPEVIKAYWSIPSEMRMPVYKNMEKWFLRKAFDEAGILPESVLWRKKEAFSDGISCITKSWYQIIQEFVEDKVTDEELASAANKYPFCIPTTKEAYYYRRIFCDIFGEKRQGIIPRYWLPKWDKNGQEVTEYIDPSARTLDVYNSLGKTD